NIGDVDIASAIPAGTNTIGKVDLNAGTNTVGKTYLTDGTRDATVKAASTAALATDTALVTAFHPSTALPAGTNNIGDVDIASAIPAGTNTIGKVDVNQVYAEDSASADGHNLFVAGAVREDTLATSTSATGDYTWLKTNNVGRLWSSTVIDTKLPTGDNTIGKVDVNQVYAEDVASVGGENLFLAGAIRQDSIGSTTTDNGDYSHLKVNAVGRLYTATTLDASLPLGSNTIGKVQLEATNGASGLAVATIRAGSSAPVAADTALVVTIRDAISVNSSGTVGKLASNDGVDIGDVTINNASIPVTQSGAWSLSTVTSITTANLAADDVHDGFAGTTLVMTGGFANANAPTAVADGDAARLWTTLNGALNIADAGGSLTVDAPVGTPVHVRLSDGTSAISALPITDNNGSLTVDAAVGSPVHVRLSDGTNAISALPITDNNGSLTVDGTVNAVQSGAWAVTANAPVKTVTGLQITGILGQFLCVANQLYAGELITLTGTAPSGTAGSITGYTPGNTYKILATNGTTTFQIVNLDGSSVTTTANSGGTTVLQGTINVPTQVSNLAQLGGKDIVLGSGVRTLSTLRVTVATDDIIPASQSGTWTVQPGNTPNTTPWLVGYKTEATTATALGALNATASIATGGFTSFSMLVSVATSPTMTIDVEVSPNGTTWVASSAWFILGTTVFSNQITNPTLNNVYQIITQPGYQFLRVRVSAFTSGTCSVILYNNAAQDNSAFPIFSSQNNTANPSPYVAMMGGWTGTAVSRLRTNTNGHMIIDSGANTLSVGGTVNSQATTVASQTVLNATVNAYTTNLVIKAGPGNLYILSGYNSSASGQFIQVHNAVSLPSNNAVPSVTFYVAPTSNFSFDFGVYGRYF
ncbi:MAG: hypothetical protein EB023_10085, partial [Flavobacteriia bacterium]|nr:hypothetical protein [Flavobacteriia bacterium]